MLEATIAIQLAIGASVEAAMVGFLLLFNTVLGFLQESRANAALGVFAIRPYSRISPRTPPSATATTIPSL